MHKRPRYTAKHELARRAFQGHRMVSNVEVEKRENTIELKKGDVIVPTDQPLARLIVNLLEPQSADGLCTWNYFDAALESGDYPIMRLERE